MTVTLVVEAIDDCARHRKDTEINTRPAVRLNWSVDFNSILTRKASSRSNVLRHREQKQNGTGTGTGNTDGGQHSQAVSGGFCGSDVGVWSWLWC